MVITSGNKILCAHYMNIDNNNEWPQDGDLCHAAV